MTRKPPPHDDEIEKCVLACMILEGCTDERLRQSMFCGEFNAECFRALSGMSLRGEAIDAVTMSRTLSKNGVQVDVLKVNRILETVPNTGHFTAYVDELVRVYKRRRMLDAARWLYQKAYDRTSDPDECCRVIQSGKWLDKDE